MTTNNPIYRMSHSSRFDALDNLIHKILKFMSNYDKSNIELYIRKTIQNNALLKTNLTHIYGIIVKYFKVLKLKRDENRQDFIVSKILSFMESFRPGMLSADMKVIDIGGGNGNVLSGMNDVLKGDKSNFVCLNQKIGLNIIIMTIQM